MAQSGDNGSVDDLELKVVTKRAPSASELADLKFAFKVYDRDEDGYISNGDLFGVV